MYIQKIHIKNFRLLEDVELSLEERTTVIVGRNNSGKTSLAELFRRLLSEDSPKFNLEDFSLGTHEQFWIAFTLKQTSNDEVKIREALPIIEIQLTVSYDKNATSLGPLSDFIIDLNPDCTDALIYIQYQLEDGKIKAFFDDIELDTTVSESEQKINFFRALKQKERLRYYNPNLFAVDPNDVNNQKHLDWPKLRGLLQSGFINAQRGLDDTTHKDNDILGKILEALFNTAALDSADLNDQEIAKELEDAIQTVQQEMGEGFNKQLTKLLPTFTLFGYPGLSDPNLLTETLLNVKTLLTNHTHIRYSGINGINLPEAYNGLGVRNLIFILLKLLEFFKSYQAKQALSGIHLVFIEEPEAHLHPQMQEVFICQLKEIADVFGKEYKQSWPVQFIVTTHSSHVANKAEFNSMRYFLATPKHDANNLYMTKIKDLRKGLSDTKDKNDLKFLHQYMTLTRCDLLFADKAILIEGTTERLLMPKLIEKVDKDQTNNNLKLASQYISVMEVGGAYAHIFFKLLDFLELPTLIITDIDAIDGNREACKVSKGTQTSNACINKWFAKKETSAIQANNEATEPVNFSPLELINKSDEEKTCSNRYITYQIPEAKDRACGRSFEDAFILANLKLFGLTDGSAEENEAEAYTKAQAVKKSEFALRYAIEKTEWKIPLYIKDGLIWLAQNSKLQPSNPPVVTDGNNEESDTVTKHEALHD